MEQRANLPHPRLLTKTVEFALSFTVIQFIYDQKKRRCIFTGGEREREEDQIDRSVGTVYRGGFEYQLLLSVAPQEEEDDEEEDDEEEGEKRGRRGGS